MESKDRGCFLNSLGVILWTLMICISPLWFYPLIMWSVSLKRPSLIVVGFVISFHLVLLIEETFFRFTGTVYRDGQERRIHSKARRMSNWVLGIGLFMVLGLEWKNIEWAWEIIYSTLDKILIFFGV